jgi:hypothetical protein
VNSEIGEKNDGDQGKWDCHAKKEGSVESRDTVRSAQFR